MLPPAARLTTGKEFMLNMLPALITSEWRKNTMLSPSVWPGGTGITTTGSPLKNILFVSFEPGDRGPRALRSRGLLAGWGAHAVEHLFSGDDGRPAIAIAQIAADHRRAVAGPGLSLPPVRSASKLVLMI